MPGVDVEPEAVRAVSGTPRRRTTIMKVSDNKGIESRTSAYYIAHWIKSYDTGICRCPQTHVHEDDQTEGRVVSVVQ